MHTSKYSIFEVFAVECTCKFQVKLAAAILKWKQILCLLFKASYIQFWPQVRISRIRFPCNIYKIHFSTQERQKSNSSWPWTTWTMHETHREHGKPHAYLDEIQMQVPSQVPAAGPISNSNKIPLQSQIRTAMRFRQNLDYRWRWKGFHVEIRSLKTQLDETWASWNLAHGQATEVFHFF